MPTTLSSTIALLGRHAWWLLLLYIAALLTGTHIPMQGVVAEGLMSNDKLLHFSAYGVLSVLLGLCLTPPGARLSPWKGLLAWLAIITLAAADELTQPLVGRSCDLLDWVADAAGAALMLTAYALWTARRPASRLRQPAA